MKILETWIMLMIHNDITCKYTFGHHADITYSKAKLNILKGTIM